MSYTNTLSSTVLGPLTTTFTPAAACTVAVAACSTCNSGWQAQSCSSANTMIDDRSCWPPRSIGAYERQVPLMAWGLYSPGLVCPSGYSTACSWDGAKETGDFNFMFKPDASETAVGCCPTGFACTLPFGLIGQTCVGLITTNSVPTVTCASGTSDSFKYQTIPYAIFENTTTITVSTFTVYAPLIQMNYQSSDIPGFEANADSETSSASSTSSTPTSTPSSTSAPVQGGLSAGAAAGIGIGAALVTIALATGIICLILAYRRKNAGRIHELEQPPSGSAGRDTSGQQYTGQQHTGQQYIPYHELDPEGRKVEMDTNSKHMYFPVEVFEVATPPAELGDNRRLY